MEDRILSMEDFGAHFWALRGGATELLKLTPTFLLVSLGEPTFRKHKHKNSKT
jgi:hypothetical protein